MADKNHLYTVSGRWPFPEDMLRRDRSVPVSDKDRAKIDRLSGDSAPEDGGAIEEIRLVIPAANFQLRPNHERWKSFGWEVGASHDRPEKSDEAVSEVTHAEALKRFPMPHPDGIPETSQVCYLTGAPAYAQFENGFGQAWYGSHFDADYMHDRQGDLSGFVSDEVIAGRLQAGLLVVFDNGLSPRYDAHLPEDTALALFGRGVHTQVAELTVEQGKPRSITVDDHILPVGSGAGRVLPPPPFLRRSEAVVYHGGTARDMEAYGARFALITLASGQKITESGITAAALETYAFVRSRASALREWTVSKGNAVTSDMLK